MKYIIYSLFSFTLLLSCGDQPSGKIAGEQAVQNSSEKSVSFNHHIDSLIQSHESIIEHVDSALCSTSPSIQIFMGQSENSTFIRVHNRYDFSEEDIFFIYMDSSLQFIKMDEMEIDRFKAHRRSVEYFDYSAENKEVSVLAKVASGNTFSIDSNFRNKILIQSNSNQIEILDQIAEELIKGERTSLQTIYCY